MFFHTPRKNTAQLEMTCGVCHFISPKPFYFAFIFLFPGFILASISAFRAGFNNIHQRLFVISKPVMSAITLVDEDHMHQLGPYLENVALA